MAIPYKTAAKSLKKAVVKHKKPVVAQKGAVPVKGKPLFTPPGMEVESAAEDRSKGEEKD